MSARAATGAAGRGLDWLNLFVANVQTGFGPFIAVYLTTRGWTQTAIGLALTLGTVTAMASQMPAGALVDAIDRKTLVAVFSIVAFTASALLFAVVPTPLGVYVAEILHGFSSCTLGPAIAAMSLALAGRATFGVRLGRNARYASIGNAVGAALMGACGYLVSTRSVFFLTAALTLPAIFALVPLRPFDRPPPSHDAPVRPTRLGTVLANRQLLVFAACAMLFTCGNAAMLPLMSAAITKRVPTEASLIIATFIVLPQLVVALLSPTVGAWAQRHGRRLVLIIGLAALPLRGCLFAAVANPFYLMPVQLLDGVSAACLAVLVPLVVSDLAAGTGHYTLSLGVVGFAIGIGAAVSTTIAGPTADRFGDPAALLLLAALALAAIVLAVFAMRETASPCASKRTAAG
jgi:MFS family permease